MPLEKEKLALLDTKHLATYTLGDFTVESEVLQMFNDQCAVYMERLRSSQNTREWCEAAHSLKGAARGVGAFRVGLRAEQLEQVEDPLNHSIRSAILSLLEADLKQTKAAILRHLDISGQTAFV